MTSAASVVRQALIDAGQSSLPFHGGAWPAFVGSTWDLNLNLVALYDTTPIKDGRISRTGEVIEHKGVQLLISTLDYEDGWVKFRDVMQAINEMRNLEVTVDGTTFTIVNAKKESAAHIGVDERRRQLFSANYIVTIAEGA
jgi:hypothetical protein